MTTDVNTPANSPHGLDPATTAFLDGELAMWIDGERRPAADGRTFSTLNPATGQVLAEVPLASAADVEEAVTAAERAFRERWRDRVRPSEKAALLWRLADLIERDRQVLTELETLDNGKPLAKAKYDVLGAIAHFRYYAGWATKIEGSTIPVQRDRLVYTRREPVGVTGLIVPWNFPLMMASWKLAPALACGNTCVLKPAEQTPLSALYLGRLVKEAGFPDGVVNIVTGPGTPTGEAITGHPRIDKVSFTGSTAIGRRILHASAESNLKRVSLELGGKSPNVVFADADLDAVLRSVHWASFYNTGQECTLGSRLYVHKEVYEPVLEGLRARADKLRVGPGLENPDLGPMVSREQMQTVLDYVASGVEQGADLLLGGERLEGDLADGFFLPPTIFTHRDDRLRIVQEEIFGPVVTVSAFEDEEEAVSRANDTPYGLAAAVWTRDLSRAHRVADRIRSGTVWVNGYDFFDPAVPFGGFGHSGFGKEMGRSAIELYTREKAVWVAL